MHNKKLSIPRDAAEKSLPCHPATKIEDKWCQRIKNIMLWKSGIYLIRERLRYLWSNKTTALEDSCNKNLKIRSTSPKNKNRFKFWKFQDLGLSWQLSLNVVLTAIELLLSHKVALSSLFVMVTTKNIDTIKIKVWVLHMSVFILRPLHWDEVWQYTKTFGGGCSLKKDAIKLFEWHPK
jgi:hypothetical protein